MQLKCPRAVRDALAAATCSALAGMPKAASAADDWQVDGAVLSYNEKDRVSIVEPVIFATRALGEDDLFNLKLVIDTMTGATPNGAAPTNRPQTFTGASGNDRYTAPANTLPTRSFQDARLAVSADRDRALSATSRLTYGANVSREEDYFSLGASSTWSRDFNDKLTTFTAGLAGSFELILPQGGAPPAMTLMSTAAANTGGVGEEEEGADGEADGETKRLAEAVAGLTRVLNRTTLMQLNYSLGYTRGYLSDPYKIVSEINGTTGVTLDYRFERRPDSRLRQALYWKTVTQLAGTVLNVSYRYYWDDWNIVAHTVDMKYRIDLGSRHYMQPIARYYIQSAARFYRHSLIRDATPPDFASADYRLAAMNSYTLGLKYGHASGKSGEWSVRAEYMRQAGDDHPANAVGVQLHQDLYPDLHVVILQVGYGARF